MCPNSNTVTEQTLGQQTDVESQNSWRKWYNFEDEPEINENSFRMITFNVANLDTENDVRIDFLSVIFCCTIISSILTLILFLLIIGTHLGV